MIQSALWRLSLLGLFSLSAFAQPTISSTSPSSDISGPSHANDVVAIQGAGYCSGSQVFFVIQGIGNLLSTSVQSATQLTATIPGSLLANSDPNSFLYVGNGNSCTASGASNSSPFPVSAPALTVDNPTLPNATQNQPYSAQIQASGGVAPYSISVPPAQFPPGLTVSSNGLVSGTPTAVGNYTLQATITDGAGNVSEPIDVSLRVNPVGGLAPVLTSLSPNQRTAGAPGFILTITGTPICPGANLFFGTNTAPLTIINSGQAQATIPAAFFTSPGTRQVFYQNPSGPLGNCFSPGNSNSLTFTINSPPIISPSSLPPGQVGVTYTQVFTGSQGVPPYFFSLTSGTLPAGLNFDSSAGRINGIPTTPGTSTFKIQISDSNGAFATQGYTLVITSPFSVTSVNPSTAPTGSPDLPITISGTGFCTSSIVRFDTTQIASALGNGSTTLLATIPSTLLQTARIATLSVDNTLCPVSGSGSLPFTVTNTLQISTTSLPSGIVGTPYSQAITTSGGTAPVTLTVTGLPAGLSFVNGVIMGTPTVAGVFSVVATATDSSTTPVTRTLTYSLSIASLLQISPASLPSGVIGVPYSQPVTATGGTAPVTLTVTGLPAGLSFVNGAITGTPTASGLFSVVATATDASRLAQIKTLTYSLFIAPQFSLISVTPSSALAGSPDLPVAINGTGLCGSTVVQFDGTPLNVTATQAGVLATVPAALLQNPHTATIAVDNTRCPSGGSGSLPFTVIALLQIAPPTLPTAIVGANYSQPITVSGGTPPYSISLSNLPGGFSFNNGVLSGLPSAPGVFSIIATATDSGTPPQTRTITYSLTVLSPVTFLTTTLSDAFQNLAYQAQILVKGGVAPFTFSLVNASAFPRGLNLSPGGQISGTPTTPGTYTFTVQVADSQSIQPSPLPSQTFTLRVLSTTPQLQITNTALPNGRVAQPYAFALSALGGDGNYTWALLNPQPDLQVNAAGFLFGTPATAGTRQLTIKVTDGKGATAQATLSLTIDPGLLSIPAAPTTTLIVGATYTQPLAVNGGAGPFQFSILSGIVPPGVTLNGSTLSGIVTTPGTFTFTVQALDPTKNTATQTYTVVVVPALTILTTSLNAVSPGVAYSQTIQVSGGTPPYTFTLSKGSLPNGLNLSSGGVISGTPTGSGSFSFTVQVADSATQVKTQDYTLTLGNGLIITTASPLPNGILNQPYNQAIVAAGGTGATQFVVTAGSLPAGLTLSSGGSISGQPTAPGTATFTIQATDAAKVTATKSFSLTILATLSITTTSLPAGQVGAQYSQPITATGGTGQLLFSIASGTLPPGILLSPDGTLTGRPTANGPFAFTVQVTDAAQSTATQSLTIQVGLPPAPTVIVSGVPATAAPTDQSLLAVSLSGAFPIPVTGTAIITFTPNTVSGGDDMTVGFAGGTRTLTFTIPPNQTSAIFSQLPALSFGTTAGTITLTITASVNGQPLTLPTNVAIQTIQVSRTAPVITSVQATRTATGVSIVVNGFSTPREVTSARFQFQTRGAVQSSDLTVQVGDAFKAFYGGATAAATGSQFTLTEPFTVSGSSSITGVSVTLTNSVGTSNTVTILF